MNVVEVRHICLNCRIEHPNWTFGTGKPLTKFSRGTVWPFGEELIKNKCDACGHMMVGRPVIGRVDEESEYTLADMRDVS